MTCCEIEQSTLLLKHSRVANYDVRALHTVQTNHQERDCKYKAENHTDELRKVYHMGHQTGTDLSKLTFNW
jgi:hypothetical protein